MGQIIYSPTFNIHTVDIQVLCRYNYVQRWYVWICTFGRITKGIGSKYVCAYLDIEKLLITKVYTGILSGSMSIEEFQTGVQ